jgi:hypothetical protein
VARRASGRGRGRPKATFTNLTSRAQPARRPRPSELRFPLSLGRQGGEGDEDFRTRSGCASSGRSADRGDRFGGGGNIGFGFNARDISGFPTGSATLTGGGAYNPTTGFVHSAGGFRCTSDINQGPLAGCLSGEGVRWDTVELLSSTTFKCTGAAAEQEPPAVTDENTVVLLADFYRAGDGNDESFTAQMIVSADDIAPDILGIQNVWIQGVGCASAIANFSS